MNRHYRGMHQWNFELVDGTLVEKAMGMKESILAAYISRLLGNYVDEHDLGVVAEMASRVLVMYAGRVVEEAPVEALFARPSHPYTEGLLAAVPRLGVEQERLTTIPGTVPAATDWPSGCRFRERCASAFDRCVTDEPTLVHVGPAHRAACHLVEAPERRVSQSVSQSVPRSAPQS